MYKVTKRVYGKASDGRTILLYTPGMTISDDDAKRAGLMRGKVAPETPAKGLTIKKPARTDVTDEAPKAQPLDRMKLDELRAVCDEEGIDPLGANTRAEYIETIELSREAAAPPEGSAAETATPPVED
jgi:hypothetical protein